MTKQDLITVVGSKTGQNDSHVRPIIEATLDAIKECVQRKEPVYLRGFGTFQPKKRAEKKARNIWKIQCKMPPKTKRFYPLVPK